MKHLVNVLGNGETRLKFKYLELFRKLHIKNGVLHTDYITSKQYNHLIKLLKHFDAELELIEVHLSNIKITLYKVLNQEKFVEFLSKYIDLNQPTWNVSGRIINFDKLYKHVQPSKIK